MIRVTETTNQSRRLHQRTIKLAEQIS